MKRWIGLLILALLLTGCDRQDPPPSTTPTMAPTQPQTQPTTESNATEPPLPDVLSQWYVTLDQEYTAVAPMGEDLVLFGNNIVTRIDGNGTVLASLEATLPLPHSGMIRLLEDGIVYYHAAANAVVALDSDLKETGRTRLTEPVSGDPYFSQDGNCLYYCTSAGIRIWDSKTGISRNLKVHEGNWLGFTGSLRDGLWLRCDLQSDDGTVRTLLISAENGESVYEGEILNHLLGSGDFYCCLTDSEWIFGQPEQRPQLLMVDGAIPLPQLQTAITVTATETGVVLDYYDLTTGLRTASEHFQDVSGITGMTVHQGNLIFLDGCRLYTWDFSVSPELNPVEDDTVYTALRYTLESPDLEGLAACQTRAEALEQLYGIDILLWQDVPTAAPEGYTFGIEHRTHIYDQALSTLEAALAKFPEGFLRKAASWTDDGKLHIVLAKTVTTPENVCHSVCGTQYLLGTNAYIALEMGSDLERSFYHTLAHVIDTYVLSNSAKFYEWDKLNPSGFSYDKDYTSWQDRTSKYLEGSTRYFVNSFAMSFPVEDRATLLEYAMTAGNESVFDSKYMQAKLKRIHQGLKDAFDLDGSDYPWQQYLQ